MQDQLKNELYDVISGKSQVRFGTVIQAIASYVGECAKPSSKIENPKQFKEQETKRLEKFITENHLWITSIDFSQCVSEGAEQKVYLKDPYDDFNPDIGLILEDLYRNNSGLGMSSSV